MKKTVIAVAAVLGLVLPAVAADFGTAAEAEALVAKLSKAVALDSATAVKEVNAKDLKWVQPNSDLYPVVLDMSALVLASGANAALVGKSAIGLKDPDGKQFVKEYLEATKAKGKSWTDFRVTDPVTKKILPKSMYCEKVELKSGDVIVCAGIYKR